MLENIPANEAEQIQHIVELTIQQLQGRYTDEKPVLRGVHPKSHGCVTATLEVLPHLDESLRCGVFSRPGRKFAALVRFSNASALVTPDSGLPTDGTPPVHGSRGMAIKLLGLVEDDGPMLETVYGPRTQDFLLINQPVFAFANVEDYEGLSQVLLDSKDNPAAIQAFLVGRMPSPPTAAPTTPVQLRALETGGLLKRIRAASVPPAFQHPPASPVDNHYFGAAPFMFGPNHVMRYRAVTQAPSTKVPDVMDPDYLRTALVERLRDQARGAVVFHFEVQVRAADSINPDVDIENACHDWKEDHTCRFHHVATLTIPLQEFSSAEQEQRCERLVFTPWHGLEAHRPLGGINRLRRDVYKASAQFRNLPKEPTVP